MSDKVLIVDDKQMMRDSVGATLQRVGYQVIAAGDGKAALQMVSRHRPAAVLTDLKMPEMTGLELLTRLKEADEQLPVVLMTAYGAVNDAVAAMKHGAFDFIQKPFEGDQLVMVTRRAVEQRGAGEAADATANGRSVGVSTPQSDEQTMIGRSPAMRGLMHQLDQVADASATVLIAGESGAGKEVVAQAVHARSRRRDRPLLCVNCAALSSSLLESELFGHEKGAFTGAEQLRKGRFELADGGTLLLDEISEIPPSLQAKLLRVLQEGQFERVGSSATIQVDVRVLATTNRDLARSVAAGQFRQDLYYRLNVLPLHLPPLRNRPEDVPLLAGCFLKAAARRESRAPQLFDEEAMRMLQNHPWPGNVRELQNICERAGVLSREAVIDAAVIQPWLTAAAPCPAAAGAGAGGGMLAADGFAAAHDLEAASTAGPWSAPWSAAPLPRPTAPPATAASPPPPFPQTSPRAAPSALPLGVIRPLEQVERDQIIQTLGHFNGNRQRTAQALGIGVRTLGLKIKRWKEQQLIAQTT